MEKRQRFIINFLYFAIILVIAAVLLKFALPLLAPFVIGFLIAYCLRRPVRFLAARCRIPWKIAAALMVLIFYVTVGNTGGASGDPGVFHGQPAGGITSPGPVPDLCKSADDRHF